MLIVDVFKDRLEVIDLDIRERDRECVYASHVVFNT